MDCEKEELNGIILRLYYKKIRANDGVVGSIFVPDELFKSPLVKGRSNDLRREFHLRISMFGHSIDFLKSYKCDDLFVIADRDYEGIEIQDTNIEYLKDVSMQELKYLLGVSNVNK
jgi:hypothetical protein